MQKGMPALAVVLTLAVALPAGAQSILPPAAKEGQPPPTEAKSPPATAQAPPGADAAQMPPADARKLTRSERRQAARESREAARVIDTFSDAASTFADIVNHTVADRPSGVRLSLAAARGDLARLRKVLKEETFTALEGKMGEMEVAEQSGNLTATALVATEAFRMLAHAIDPRMRRAPLELTLQTYSAFKLMVLASAGTIDWTAVAEAAKEAEKSWISLRRIVREPNLRVLLSEAQAGLRDAAVRNDAAGVRFAARVQLATFPLVREFFERFAEAMARSGGDMRKMQQQMQRRR